MKFIKCVLTLKAMDVLDSIQDTSIEAYNLPFAVHAIAEVVAVSSAVAYDRPNAVAVFAPMVLVWADLNLMGRKKFGNNVWISYDKSAQSLSCDQIGRLVSPFTWW